MNTNQVHQVPRFYFKPEAATHCIHIVHPVQWFGATRMFELHRFLIQTFVAPVILNTNNRFGFDYFGSGSFCFPPALTFSTFAVRVKA